MRLLHTFTLIILAAATALQPVDAYWLVGVENFITTERLDPVVSPGRISSHVHSSIFPDTLEFSTRLKLFSVLVLGGSNFRFNTTTAQLRESDCTSIPIPEDKSNYWFPHLYFQWANGSFTSLDGGAVILSILSTPGLTTAFPDDFRMLSGDPTLRTYDSASYAQQANFPSCWDGRNLDSLNHKSHVAFRSGGPDQGSCTDPNFPVTLPRIFMEVYWGSNQFDQFRSQAMNTTQPFVFSYGDRTGYGYHADFINGWDSGILQKAVDGCTCNDFGDPTCCVDKGIFHMNQGQSCRITKSVDEITLGTLPKLPGNNPVQEEGARAIIFPDDSTPGLISPVYAYTGDLPTQTGTLSTPASTIGGTSTSSTSPASTTSIIPNPSSIPTITLMSTTLVSPTSSITSTSATSSSTIKSTAHPTTSTTARATTSAPRAGTTITIPGLTTITILLPTLLPGLPL
ncbi:hypothetical protein BDQ12DRAFT_734950 [Crucibulum laeve]|uniref:DUF1996 domain-containing protein n=1 Tax=Crucibulum laeve TaxID=68775 RepID=A0A5C3M2Y8_9AGAR|nr:hypothetical protein BDQ12DRAFT_734950 [Crucibulum laeve]